jgi:hypothetical protein
MRQRLAIIVTIAVVLGLLILLNVANYVQTTEPADSELTPNRSTYNSGATGTRVLYDLLNEAGYKVMRWRESPNLLLSQSRAKVSTFVVIGRIRLPFEENEAKDLLSWVTQGGRLVIIDRNPDFRLLAKSGEWTIASYFSEYPSPDIDPAKVEEMTAGISAIHPVQPTLLTREVQAVRPSRFAAFVTFFREKAKTEAKPQEHGGITIKPVPFEKESPAPLPAASPENKPPPAIVTSPAPVVHLSDAKGAVLLDYPHGAGRIIVLSDPYIVANGGIKLEDNLQLAIDTIAGSSGLIAFDEYHQGRAANHNALISYFAGTPILAICGQFILIVLIILWTRGRRFGRP